MQLPRELAWTTGLGVAITAGYLTAAASGTPAASGLVGHGLGILGFIAMAAGTGGYTWRKRRNGPGALQHWLEAHVITGLLGPYLILLHTGFVFRGLAGVAFLLLMVVVASGLLGRFVYTRVPKPPPGYAAPLPAHAAPASLVGPRWTTVERLTSPVDSLARAEVTTAAVDHRIAAHEERVASARVALKRRRAVSVWWLLHVPLALATFVLAVVHVLAALYYATLIR